MEAATRCIGRGHPVDDGERGVPDQRGELSRPRISAELPSVLVGGPALKTAVATVTAAHPTNRGSQIAVPGPVWLHRSASTGSPGCEGMIVCAMVRLPCEEAAVDRQHHPVIQDAASEARNISASATSSGVPTRPRG